MKEVLLTIFKIYTQIPSYARASVFWCRLCLCRLQPTTLLRKRLWRRRVPVKFTKFLRIPFSIEHLRCLFLTIAVERFNWMTYKSRLTHSRPMAQLNFVELYWCTDVSPTAQEMKFPIKDFFSKCDQIRSFLQIWSHLLKKSLMENFHFLCSARFSILLETSQLIYTAQWNIGLKWVYRGLSYYSNK